MQEVCLVCYIYTNVHIHMLFVSVKAKHLFTFWNITECNNHLGHKLVQTKVVESWLEGEVKEEVSVFDDGRNMVIRVGNVWALLVVGVVWP